MLIIKYIKSGRNKRERERVGRERETQIVCMYVFFKQIFEIKTIFSSREFKFRSDQSCVCWLVCLLYMFSLHHHFFLFQIAVSYDFETGGDISYGTSGVGDLTSSSM